LVAVKVFLKLSAAYILKLSVTNAIAII